MHRRPHHEPERDKRHCRDRDLENAARGVRLFVSRRAALPRRARQDRRLRRREALAFGMIAPGWNEAAPEVSRSATRVLVLQAYECAYLIASKLAICRTLQCGPPPRHCADAGVNRAAFSGRVRRNVRRSWQMHAEVQRCRSAACQRRLASAGTRRTKATIAALADGGAMYELFIANKNYSSWSLRPWAPMKTLGIPFTERLTPFPAFEPGTRSSGNSRRAARCLA